MMHSNSLLRKFYVLLVFYLNSCGVIKLENYVSLETEKKISQIAFRSFEKDLLSPDNPIHQNLNNLAQVFKKTHPDLSALNIEAFLVDRNIINAYALPGGRLVFEKKFLNQASSVEEIAGVMAHELAHIERRHILNNMSEQLGFMLAFTTLSFFVEAEILNLLVSGAEIVNLKFSRQDESEADERGLDFLLAAQINPQGLLGFLEKISQKESQSALWSTLLSTHPNSQERISMLKTKINNKKVEVKKLSFELKDFQKIP